MTFSSNLEERGGGGSVGIHYGPHLSNFDCIMEDYFRRESGRGVCRCEHRIIPEANQSIYPGSMWRECDENLKFRSLDRLRKHHHVSEVDNKLRQFILAGNRDIQHSGLCADGC